MITYKDCLKLFSLAFLTLLFLYMCDFTSKHIGNNKIIIDNTNLHIDSVKQENNKLVLEVQQLDSAKNAEIIEVKKLDNDSTLSLFYQLISK